MALNMVVYPSLLEDMQKHEMDILRTCMGSGAFASFCIRHINFMSTEIGNLSPDSESFKDQYRELQCGLKLWQGLLEFSQEAKSMLKEQGNAD